MIDHDALFKSLIGEFFLEFLQLFFPEMAAEIDPTSITEKEQELMTDLQEGRTKRIDLIRQVQLKEEPTLVLILVEPQSYNDKQFGERLFRYCTRLYDKYRLPIFPVAVLSNNSPKAAAPNSFKVEFRHFTAMTLNYLTIQLNRLDWQEYADKNNPIACAFMAKMPVAKGERPKLKLLALNKLTDLKLNPAQLRLVSGFIDTYLELNKQEQIQFEQELSKVEGKKKEAVMELTTSWKREGIREGEINLLVKQLTRRLGALSLEEETEVRSLNVTQLENLGEAILDFQSREDFTSWLKNNPV